MVGKISMTVVNESVTASGAAPKGGYRMMQGQRIPPSVTHDFIPLNGAVAAQAHRGPVPQFSNLSFQSWTAPSSVLSLDECLILTVPHKRVCVSDVLEAVVIIFLKNVGHSRRSTHHLVTGQISPRHISE